MDFKREKAIDTKELKAVIATAKKYCGKNKDIPVLNNVLMSVADNKLTIRSTDLTTWYQCTLSNKIESMCFSVLIDPIQLLNCLKTIKDKHVNLHVSDNILHVYIDILKPIASMSISEVDGYPEPPIMDDATFLTTLEGSTIKQLAMGCRDFNSYPHPFTGICCNPVDKCFYATNGDIMYRYKRFGASCDKNVIINANKLSNLLDCEYSIYYSDKYVFLLSTNETILTDNIDGTYPGCKNITPTNNVESFTVDSKTLKDAINSIKHTINDFNNIIVLTLEGNTLTLSNRDNTTSVNIAVDNTLNKDLRVSFNYKYLLQLSGLGNLVFKVNENVRYSHLSAVTIETTDFDVLLAPLRLDK